jgi:hypothetical protein
MEKEQRSLDEEREVELVEDGEPLLPEQTRDDTDQGWGDYGDRAASNDDRLLAERPPHWD